MLTVFADFCTNMDIIHKVTSAYHHQSNFAERGVPDHQETNEKMWRKLAIWIARISMHAY